MCKTISEALEQAKNIDPKGYHLSAAKGFIRRNTDLSGLPGLEFDLRPEGDHIWLHLARPAETESGEAEQQCSAECSFAEC